ncbi:MAG: hypothetical protein KF901_05945 [Myxococcales bacterium]|nr:hypothetical protein [Myxococcales bacterium]
MFRRSILILLALGGLSACSDASDASEAPATAAAAPAAPTTFEYTESLSVDAIPGFPAKGVANGREIAIQAVYFQPRFDEWGLTLSTEALDRPTAVGGSADAESVNLSGLPQELGVGTYTHTIEQRGGGYFQIKKPDDPTRTTSWNTSTAYIVHITKWEVEPWNPEGSIFQDAGRASGKVVAVFRGNGNDFQNSWVAGTFEDAVVRYMGRPRWIPDPNAAE